MINPYSYLRARQSICTRSSHWLTDPRLVLGSVSLWAWLGREEDCRALCYTNFEFVTLGTYACQDGRFANQAILGVTGVYYFILALFPGGRVPKTSLAIQCTTRFRELYDDEDMAHFLSQKSAKINRTGYNLVKNLCGPDSTSGFFA